MAQESGKRQNRSGETTKNIGFRLPLRIIDEIKIEAARRKMPANALFLEIWETYKKTARSRTEGK